MTSLTARPAQFCGGHRPVPLYQPLAPDFPDRVLRARLSVGLTRHQLARRISYSPDSIKNWETGAVVPMRRSVKALAAAFGRDLWWFYDTSFTREAA